MATTLKFKSKIPPQLAAGKMRLKVTNALKRVRTQMIIEFRKTVETWEEPPEFEGKGGEVRAKELTAAISVETDDDIYGLVNEGSPPHFIGPRGDYMLFFHSEYTKKTRPGEIRSYAGGPGPKNRLIEFIPEHPGFPGRHFDQQVAQSMQRFFEFELSTAMREAAEVSGWAK